MKILILDNYDSFTYNLVHLVDKLTSEPVEVYRNDKIPIDEISAYDKIPDRVFRKMRASCRR
jgi:anthranilate synthase component 2